MCLLFMGEEGRYDILMTRKYCMTALNYRIPALDGSSRCSFCAVLLVFSAEELSVLCIEQSLETSNTQKNHKV